ncbi:Utp21-domain-containing protein [Cyathus striatus]|nr:Utp21-domain-containing protein [Cyathus striatus]
MLATVPADDIYGPPRKRLRQDASKVAKRPSEPRLFVPFRALGLITNHVPFVLQTRSYKGSTDGPRVHILTCLGRSWSLWEGGKMTLLFVGPDAPAQISSLTMDGDAVWASAGPHTIKYLRGKEVLQTTNPLDKNLAFITIFGSQILALTEDGDRMLLWNTADGTLDASIQFERGFTATSILHPSTYLNKVLVASTEGDMELWNIQTQTCIHKFSASRLSSTPESSSKESQSAITALVQSPAIDVVGVGFSSGEISVYDVRADERLMRMFMEGGSIRALGFRNDGHPILASASSSGNIAIWDLNSGGRLLHMIRGAHDAAVTAAEWIPGQPVLVTSGEDNSVKVPMAIRFTDVCARLLKFRAGHNAPPHLIRYYGDDGKQLLTASRDRSLRYTSVVRDSRSFELSQGSLAKKATTLSIPIASLKFPPITAIAYSTTRTKDWDDIVTAHTDETFARTWTMLGKKLGKHSLAFSDKGKGKERGPVGSVKSICVTACGNFCIAGSSTGQINMWNMQSGIKGRSFDVGPCPPETVARLHSASKKRSERSITGIATDSLNRVLIANTFDGTINFFDFQTAQLEHTLILPSTAISILLHRDSGLLAVVSDDMVVRVVDVETRRIVRELGGFSGRILDITFSPDSRWLITSSLDSIIRTFDVPTGPISISFSPTNDFLATSHVDSVGVFLWANRAQYAEVSFQSITDADLGEVSLPSVQGIAEDEAMEGLEALTVNEAPEDVFSTLRNWMGPHNAHTSSPRQVADVVELGSYSAPFFIPTLPGVEMRFDVAKKENDANKARRLDKATSRASSVFHKKLLAEKESGNYESFFNFAKTLSPAALDLELRTLNSIDDLRAFINALTKVQAFQSVFIRMHGDIITANIELQGDMDKLLVVQKKESHRVLELISSSLGTLSFVRDTL